MPLAHGQVQIRDLVLGLGTPYHIRRGLNPWDLEVRAPSEQARPWGHGNVSGAEWGAPVEIVGAVTFRSADPAELDQLQDALVAAFRPVGDDTEPVELRWGAAGREYVRFGRPRGAVTAGRRIVGHSTVQCTFKPLDPRRYDAQVQSATFGLPTFEGGLTVPFTVPFTVDAVPVDGQADLTNEGTTETGLTLKIVGPVSEPRVTVQGPDGSETLRYLGDIPDNRFLLVDTAKRTALVDGLPQANRRGQVSGEWPLLPGNPDGSGATSTVLFRASNNEAAGTLTASARSAWW